jgi:hypothetical protein
MNKILPFVLLLIISAILIQPIDIKANSNDDITYEVVKRNPDLVITGCNETYVYWKFKIRKFDPPIEIRPYVNESEYLDEMYSTYYYETIFIKYRLAAKYDLKSVYWAHYVDYMYEIEQKEFEPLKQRLFTEKGDLGIVHLGVDKLHMPIVVWVFMYKITDEKVNTVLEYIKPFVKKYNALVFFIEDIEAKSLEEKQREALDKFYSGGSTTAGWGEGFKKYLELVKKYYNISIKAKSVVHGRGETTLFIPENATFNEEFVRKAVSILREYAGCEVPLVVNFEEYGEFVLLNSQQKQSGTSQIFVSPSPSKTFSLIELLILFVIIPITIFASLAIFSRKKDKKK